MHSSGLIRGRAHGHTMPYKRRDAWSRQQREFLEERGAMTSARTVEAYRCWLSLAGRRLAYNKRWRIAKQKQNFCIGGGGD